MNANQLQQLKARRYEVDQYRPPTGLGQFSFKYSPTHTPQEGLVEVTVKPYYRFLHPREEKLKEGENATYIEWDEKGKAAFRKRTLEVVKKVWSDQYKFVCAEDGSNGLSARVVIKVEEVGSPELADYVIKLKNVAFTSTNAWSGACNHTKAQFSAYFSNWAVEPREDFNGRGIFEFKYKQLQNALNELDLSLIDMEHKKVAVDGPTGLKLRKFCAAASRVVGSGVSGLECHVVGLSTEKVGHYRAWDRGKVAAAALNEAAKTGGLFKPGFFRADSSSEGRRIAHEILLKKKNLQPGQYSGAALFITVPLKSPRTFHTNYIVFAHEFGHMLGCPDEYFGINCDEIQAKMSLDILAKTGIGNQVVVPQNDMNTAQQKYRGQQTPFGKQIDKAGVDVPVFMPDKISINPEQVRDYAVAMGNERDRLRQQYGGEENFDKRAGLLAKWEEKNPRVESVTGASSSIMWGGMDVMAAHYLPIWYCLGDFTKPYFNRAKWQIVKV